MASLLFWRPHAFILTAATAGRVLIKSADQRVKVGKSDTGCEKLVQNPQQGVY